MRLTPTYKPNPGQRRATDVLRGPQRHTLLVGGARSGKTFLIVRAIVVRALRAPGSRHAILRFRYNAVRTSIWLDTLPKVMRTCFPGVSMRDQRQDGFTVLPNGSELWFGGLDDKERVEKILGQEYVTVYINEASQIPYSSVMVARTRLAQVCEGLKQREYVDLNPTGKGHWTYREFVEGRDPISGAPLANPDDYRAIFVNPGDNAANLSPEFLQSLAGLPERQRRRFFDGQYVADVDGALWTLEQIESCRIGAEDQLPPMKRVVIAVDPSGASGEEDKRSDEIGIVAAGLGNDGVAYVLGDHSLRDGPEKWGKVAVAAYHKHMADRIVAERNYGGEMVRFVIQTADKKVPVRVITASRGKHVRAEPVSALYEQGKVRHVGRFPELEDQLTNFSTAGYVGDRSPDRADAAVWALTELMLAGAAENDIGAPIQIGAGPAGVDL